MVYSDFTLDDLETKFGIKIKLGGIQFDIQPLQPSELLERDLRIAKSQSITSEKAKSEWIVVPILKELLEYNENFFKVYSGDNLNASPEEGLKGECDFILTKNVGTYNINYPIIQIVEAKRGELELGVPQCAAQLLGAHIFNKNKGVNIEKIYGCVTNGDIWLFMKLENDVVYVDMRKYPLENLPELLGAFQTIIDYYKEHLN